MTTKMTPKGFLKKLNSKAALSALGFLAAHREYLTSGELADILRPIVEKVDNGALLPTPALSQIRQAVMDHILAAEVAKAEKAIEKANAPGGTGSASKPFQAVILDVAGRVQTYIDSQGKEKEYRQNFNLPQEAERWVDRRLVDGAPNWHGEVMHNGAPWDTIERDQSMARLFKRPLSPVMKKPPTPGKLSGHIKIRAKHHSFSQG